MVTKNNKLLFFFRVWILEILTRAGVINESIFLSALRKMKKLKECGHLGKIAKKNFNFVRLHCGRCLANTLFFVQLRFVQPSFAQQLGICLTGIDQTMMVMSNWDDTLHRFRSVIPGVRCSGGLLFRGSVVPGGGGGGGVVPGPLFRLS